MSARPWANITDAVLIEMSYDDVWDLGAEWDRFHERQGCTWSNGTPSVLQHNAAKCRPADRTDPNLESRWEKLGKTCVDRGCLPDGAKTWDHVGGCRFRKRTPPIARPEDVKEVLVDLFAGALEDPRLTDNDRTVLEALCDNGIGRTSVEIAAARSWLADVTTLSEKAVRVSVGHLKAFGYVKPITRADVTRDFLKYWLSTKEGRTPALFRLGQQAPNWRSVPDFGAPLGERAVRELALAKVQN